MYPLPRQRTRMCVFRGYSGVRVINDSISCLLKASSYRWTFFDSNNVELVQLFTFLVLPILVLMIVITSFKLTDGLNAYNTNRYPGNKRVHIPRLFRGHLMSPLHSLSNRFNVLVTFLSEPDSHHRFLPHPQRTEGGGGREEG